MPRLSIVVPFLGNLKLLEDTLVSVLENRPDACQIVVVLNEGYDDPYQLRDEVSFVASRPDAGLVGGIFRGLRACQAPVVHVLACGMTVSAGWTDTVLPHFDDPAVGAVAPLVLGSTNPQRIVSAGLSYHRNGRVQCLSAGRPAGKPSRNRELSGPDARSAFYRRSALTAIAEATGGSVAALNGVDLALALGQQGLRCVFEPTCRTYAQPSLITSPGAFHTGLEEARLFWRWAPHCDRRASVASHAALLLTEALSGLLWPPNALRFAGRLVGGLGMGHRCRTEAFASPARPQAPTRSVPTPHFCTDRSVQPVTASATRGSVFSEGCSSGPAAPRRAPG